MKLARRLGALVIAAFVVGALFAPADAAAEGGRRCRALRPGCGSGATPLCICPSSTCADSACYWVCGVLG